MRITQRELFVYAADPTPPDFCAALWIGALLHATGVVIDVFPPALGELAEQFFQRYRPIARA